MRWSWDSNTKSATGQRIIHIIICWLRNRFSLFFADFNPAFYSFLQQRHCFFQSFCRSNAPGQLRHFCVESPTILFRQRIHFKLIFAFHFLTLRVSYNSLYIFYCFFNINYAHRLLPRKCMFFSFAKTRVCIYEMTSLTFLRIQNTLKGQPSHQMLHLSGCS